LVYYFWFS